MFLAGFKMSTTGSLPLPSHIATSTRLSPAATSKISTNQLQLAAGYEWNWYPLLHPVRSCDVYSLQVFTGFFLPGKKSSGKPMRSFFTSVTPPTTTLGMCRSKSWRTVAVACWCTELLGKFWHMGMCQNYHRLWTPLRPSWPACHGSRCLSSEILDRHREASLPANLDQQKPVCLSWSTGMKHYEHPLIINLLGPNY